MGERKVLNKYIPWDFDYRKIVKIKRERTRLVTVTNMLPMNVQCSTCGEFMYKGTKFNTKMEQIEGYDYKGIKLYRFYFKCENCRAIFAIRTDPEHGDYTVEFGATRNFELWRERIKAEEEDVKKLDEADQDTMVALENRTLQSKIEMDQHDRIDEMKAINAKRDQGKDNVFDSYIDNEKKKSELNLTEEEQADLDKLFKAESEKQDGEESDDDFFSQADNLFNEKKTSLDKDLTDDTFKTTIKVHKKGDRKKKKVKSLV